MESNSRTASVTACNTVNSSPSASVKPLMDANGRAMLGPNEVVEPYQNEARTGTKLDRVIAKLLRKNLYLDCSSVPQKDAINTTQITGNERNPERTSKFSVDNILNAKIQSYHWRDDGGSEREQLCGTPGTSMDYDDYKPIVEETVTEPTACHPSDYNLDPGQESGDLSFQNTTANTDISALQQSNDLVTISDESIEVDVCSNTVSETIDVVGGDVKAFKDEHSDWVEGAEVCFSFSAFFYMLRFPKVSKTATLMICL